MKFASFVSCNVAHCLKSTAYVFQKMTLSVCQAILRLAVVWMFAATPVFCRTDSPDVSALNVMYKSLNSPSQLSDWKSNGGDPCGDSWKGIKCSGTSVTEILSGLGLTGSLGYQLSSLTSVTYFDMSGNNLKGDIPYQLPPNVEHIDLSGNGFTGGVPYSVSQMSDLKFLDLGHNQLKGQLSDMFGQLRKLSMLDLSFNSLSGNLPESFRSLSSLKTLHVQNNQFTGAIDMLAGLPLNDLNVENNQFTGWIPNELKDIKKINTGGNSWSSGPAPPSPFGGRRNPRSQRSSRNDSVKSGLSLVAIAGIVLCALVMLVILISLLSKKRSYASHYLDEDTFSQNRPLTPLSSQELSAGPFGGPQQEFNGLNSFNSSPSIGTKTLQASPSMSFKPLKALQTSPSMSLKPPPIPTVRLKSFNDDEFANRLKVKRSVSVHASAYSLADLQNATGNFASGRLLGEGSIGRVYRAKYSDGKVLAVKKISSSLFQGVNAEDFSEIISGISKIQHPNIAQLRGFCSELGHNMLVYDYFRNGSLYEFLHLSDDYSKPLTWNTRLRIALGTARAVEYLHEVCSPPVIHHNIQSSNILLDMELNPCLSDCGLATFYQRSSAKLKSGYNAPECTSSSPYTLKSDVYSFGVVMLELLTGRMPLDSSKPRSEQLLVRWATPQLHDFDALSKMVDPALHGLYPPKSISRFADTVALCVQVEPEFRPPMSQVVHSLVHLSQRSNVGKRSNSGASHQSDDFDDF